MKPAIYILTLFMLGSCGYKTLEGSMKPVYFSATPVVFTDTLYPVQRIIQPYLKGLTYCVATTDLQKDETDTAYIRKPTIITKHGIQFLVYPREHILIDEKDGDPTFSTLNQNKIRDKELLVLKTFNELEKRPRVPNLIVYNYQTILDTEEALKPLVVPAEKASQLLFDSICTANGVSRKFKKYTKDYVHNKYDYLILALYVRYRDTLVAHHVYENKLKAFLTELNGIKKNQFNSNVQSHTSAMYQDLFPNDGIRNMSEAEFQPYFDTIAKLFKGPARGYLLSRVMYWATVYKFQIPTRYRRLYRQYSMDKNFRKIIARARREGKGVDSP